MLGKMIKQELNLFFHALLFYSRIPAGKITYSDNNLAQAFRYFPLVGAIVGGIGTGVGYLASLVFPHSIAIILALVAMTLSTGAFHEDGFSDFWDGFGGGHTPERVLEIMKDSTSGVYGVVSIVLLFLLKFALLYEISRDLLWVLPIVGASSRVPSIFVARFSEYARKKAIKATNLTCQTSKLSLTIALVIGILPLFFLLPWWFASIIVALYALIGWGIKTYSEARIGGYTGDVLGALQQFCEMAFLLSFVVLVKMI